MKLVEALRTVQAPMSKDAPRMRAFLACGFTPLHLETFLAAHLRTVVPERQVSIATGLYGDCLGSLQSLKAAEYDCVFVSLEWSDLDPRLGIRQISGWKPSDLDDVISTVSARSSEFARSIETAAAITAVVVCLPTLPLPPIAPNSGWNESSFSIRLNKQIGSLASSISAVAGIRLVSEQRLNQASPFSERLDVRAEFTSGFPYVLGHADAVASIMANLFSPGAPKKGLITDLDDTLWAGIVGDVGVDHVTWAQDHRGFPHALYQQLLSSLSDAGVLLAVASKNDPLVVDAAFGRRDLVCAPGRFYPVEVGWHPKSESVGRILEAWNIGAESVVFVDDSPMEIAEVQSAFPDIQCVQFPTGDALKIYALIESLRDRFGRDTITEEDAIRQVSIRVSSGARAEAATSGTSAEDFLRSAESEVEIREEKDPFDIRTFELINKTNQFNLNGKRYSEHEWRDYLSDPTSVVMSLSYKDKFGPLGSICVLAARRFEASLEIDTWVLSCRAFSRRIEDQCLDLVFRHYKPDRILLRYRKTEKNGPLSQTLHRLLGENPDGDVILTARQFQSSCPNLYHKVTFAQNGKHSI